jgi:hypothetical protein
VQPRGKIALRTISSRAAWAVLVPLGLAACDAPPATDNRAPDARAAAPAAAPAASPAPAPAAAPLVLDGGGLALPGGPGAPTLRFGAPTAKAIAFVSNALGSAPSERGRNEECGGGALDFATWKDRLTLLFEGGRFAGWDDKGGLKTAAGIGIGSRRADLAALPDLQVEDSTLGVEFRSGVVGGVLASRAPDAKVTALWAGTTCVFR